MAGPTDPPRAVRIRLARPEEYAAISELTVQVYVGGGLIPADSPYVATLADAAGRAQDAELLVAVDDTGSLLGSVTFSPPGSRYAGQVADPEDAGIRMLLVRPDAQRQGIGAALVQACLDRARELDCRWVRLSTQPNMTSAHRLYERLGFVRTPERDWSPLPGADLLTYVLELELP